MSLGAISACCPGESIGNGRHTRIVRGGKKSGDSIFSRLWYFFARCKSNFPYAAFAGRVHGGLFPDPTLIPPRKTGTRLRGSKIGVLLGMGIDYFTVTS